VAKLTYIITLSQPPFTKARVVLDGTDVHASHPENTARLVRFPNDTAEAALATFQKVIRKYFHPAQGWILDAKKPGVADLEPWGPPPPTKEEQAAIAAKARQRSLGWAMDKEVMVLALSRQRTTSDLEITLDQAKDATVLHVGTNVDDEAGVGLTALLTALEAGAAPNLDEISFDCPTEPLAKSAALRLGGLSRLLEKRQFLRFAAVGTFHWPMKAAQHDLDTLRLLSPKLTADLIERIGRTVAPELRTLQVGLSVEQEADPDACAAVMKLPMAHLEELTLVGLNDVATTMMMLLGSGRVLPKTVRLDGRCDDDDALQAAISAWHARQSSTLCVGPTLLGAIEEETIAALGDAGITPFASPFEAGQRDARVRALWAQLA